MDINLRSVEDFVNGVINGAVVIPDNVVGTGGFLFDVDGSKEVALEADVTDHYLEDLTAAQDHIALRPAMVTLKGYIGEIKDKTQGFLGGVVATINSLEDFGGLAPGFTVQAAQAYSKIESVVSRVDNVLSQANNLYQVFSRASTTQTEAQRAMQFFQNLRNKKILCRVETPFKVYENMMLIRVGAIEPEESKSISNFTVTFKEIRAVKTATTTTKAAGRAADMISSVVEKGAVVSKNVDVKILSVKP